MQLGKLCLSIPVYLWDCVASLLKSRLKCHSSQNYTGIVTVQKAYFLKLHLLLFSFLKFGVWIWNGAMRKRQLKRCPSKNMPWGHALLGAYLRDDRSTGAPVEDGSRERNRFCHIFRGSKLLHHVLQHNDIKFKPKDCRHSRAAPDKNCLPDGIQPYVVLFRR